MLKPEGPFLLYLDTTGSSQVWMSTAFMGRESLATICYVGETSVLLSVLNLCQQAKPH